MGGTAAEMLEPGEEVIFDKRHSLWEIGWNFLIGAGAVVALALLLTKFKPGPSSGTNWGYIVLISVLAAFLLAYYGLGSFLRRRKLAERSLLLPAAAAILTAAGWGALFWFRNSGGFSRIWTALVWAAFAVVTAGWVIYPLLRWYFTHFILTDRKLVLLSGILNKSFKAIPLDQVNDISGTQNVWERVFNYGDLVIESAGEFGQQPFTNIGDPKAVRTLILERRRIFLEEREGGRLASVSGMGKGSLQVEAADGASSGGEKARELELVEGLRRLDELRRSGALTEEEFQGAKRQLLDRLSEE